MDALRAGKYDVTCVTPFGSEKRSFMTRDFENSCQLSCSEFVSLAPLECRMRKNQQNQQQHVDTTATGKFLLQRRRRRFGTSSPSSPSSPPRALHTGTWWCYHIICAHSRARRRRRLLFFGREVLQTHDAMPIFP